MEPMNYFTDVGSSFKAINIIKEYNVHIFGLFTVCCSFLLAWAAHRQKDYLWAICGSMLNEFTLIATTGLFIAWLELRDRNRAGEYTRFPGLMSALESAAMLCIVLMLGESLHHLVMFLITVCFSLISSTVSSTGVWRDWLLVERSTDSGGKKEATKTKKKKQRHVKWLYLWSHCLRGASLVVSYVAIVWWLKLWDRRGEFERCQGLMRALTYGSVVPIILLVNDTLKYLLLQAVSFSVETIYSSSSSIPGFYL